MYSYIIIIQVIWNWRKVKWILCGLSPCCVLLPSAGHFTMLQNVSEEMAYCNIFRFYVTSLFTFSFSIRKKYSQTQNTYICLWSKRKIRHFSCKHIETESNSIFKCESFLKWIIPPVTTPPSCDQFHSRGSYKSDVKRSAVKNKSVHPWCHERHIISPISIIYQTFA